MKLRGNGTGGLWVGLLAAAAALSGCTTVGINTPRDEGPTTARMSYEAELIPNAELERDETSPDWFLGRYTFKRGADHLLVVTKITSMHVTTPGDEKTRRPYESIERVWITIPLGTQVGEELNLEDLEHRFLVGYDQGDRVTGMYAQPNKVLGRLTVLEEHPDHAVIKVHMRVEPQKMPSWTFKYDQLPVPITMTGVRATPSEDWATGESVPLELEGERSTIAEAGEGPGEAAAAAADAGGPAESAEGVEEVPDGAAAQELPEGWSLEGTRWIGNIPDGDDVWEHKLQFDPDGTFIFSRTRGRAPVISQGRYTVKHGYVVLEYQKFYELKGTYRNNHMFVFEKQGLDKYLAMKLIPDGDDLLLVGKMPMVRSTGPFRFKPAFFTDMNVVPPTGEKTGDQAGAGEKPDNPAGAKPGE